MNCEIFREMIGPYLEEKLDEDRRQWFRRHLRECDECRAVALGAEPSLLFAVAVTASADPLQVEACAQAVVAQIRQDRLARRLRSRRRPWLAAAAALVVMVGGAVVWRTLPGGPQVVLPAVEAQRDPGEVTAPPSIEVEMPGDDVRVYQFANDDSDTAVYFIVDPALEL
jgi:anti-sigma factor RsiW